MTYINKISKFIILLFVFITLSFTNVFAVDNEKLLNEKINMNNSVSKFAEDTIERNSTTNKREYNPSSELPNVDIGDASNWAQRKGYDVVNFLQQFIQPFSIVVFIIGAIIAMLGFLYKDALRVGLVIMGVSIVMYTAIVFAPEIIRFFSTWLAS